MSFVAPLYIAGALAISLPILFHLIRRTPHGRQTFSSLMFLSASPPRLTRRSRLNNILLLILRAAALALLAFAFARPLFYQQSDMDVSEAIGRRIALLLDTSASMRRGDLWSQAARQVDKVLAELEPTDELALFAFDRQVRPLLSFDEWNEQSRPGRGPLVRSRLAKVSPTWAATNLGEALATLADAVADDGSRPASPAVRRQVILISDLQQGSHIEPLQGYEWPAGVLLDVRSVSLSDATNASIALAEADADQGPGDERLRVRVSNQADSNREQFSLAWGDEQGPLATAEPLKTYVPPGQSRIVRVPLPAKGQTSDRLILSGDSHDFDNVLYVVPPRQEQVRLVFIGDDAPDDTQGLLYYLVGAAVETPRRKVEVIARGGSSGAGEKPLSADDLREAKLVVVASTQSNDDVALLRKFIEQGGTVLFVLKRAAAAPTAAALLGQEQLEIEEAPAREFALIARVQFDHPLFAPFADPRFADFTKIHFWKHRRVKLDSGGSARVLAWFDDGDPFLIEAPQGMGNLIIAASGWHPADSQLARSTKFVPLLAGMFPRAESVIGQSQLAILDKIELPVAKDGSARTVHKPGGADVELSAGSPVFDAADEPGIYRFTLDGKQIPIAVNLAADESHTAPLAVEELEQRGAKIGTQATAEQIAERQRQLRLAEIESRQKLWRWLIVAVLALLLIETALAGRLAHRTLQQPVPT